jgi:hypothetical protein
LFTAVANPPNVNTLKLLDVLQVTAGDVKGEPFDKFQHEINGGF